jgi:hypothetical protein
MLMILCFKHYLLSLNWILPLSVTFIAKQLISANEIYDDQI